MDSWLPHRHVARGACAWLAHVLVSPVGCREGRRGEGEGPGPAALAEARQEPGSRIFAWYSCLHAADSSFYKVTLGLTACDTLVCKSVQELVITHYGPSIGHPQCDTYQEAFS